MATTAGEKTKTRKELVRGARMGPYALWTAIVGTVVGAATCALLVAGTHYALQENNSTVDLSRAWDALGQRGALVLGGLVLLSYLCAAFVAGKMAWHRGWLHGLAAEIDLRDRIEAASHEQLAPVTAGNGDGNRDRTTADVGGDALSKDELYQRAEERDIPGRSQMTKDQLKDALQQ
jgi:hypothetical protein